MNAGSIDEKIRALASERRLPNSVLDRWLTLDAASRSALLNLATSLKMRTGQIATTLDTHEEIALRDDATIASILARDEIARAAGAKGSAPARAGAVLDAIRGLRFPRLRAAQNRLAAEIRALKLPGGVSVVLPKDLSSDEVTVSIRARSLGELTRMLDALGRAGPGLAQIYGLLGGETPDDDKAK